MKSNLGLLGRLKKQQANREYFSSLPVGTLFIVVEEIDLPAYDLTGLFLCSKPHLLSNGKYHFTGYIERGSWEILGSVQDCIGLISQVSDLDYKY